jgi:hypothetical protein
MSIISISDFQGYFSLYKGKDANTRINDYIDQWEEHYMALLLGNDLSIEITAELGNNPIPERAQKLLDNGLKKGLTAFIWFEYMRDEPFKSGGLGLKENESDAAQKTDTKSYLDTRYNKGVEIFKRIQSYIKKHRQDYSGYEKTELNLSYF